MGLAIALGAGLGVIFGKFVFDNLGVGAALGIALSRLSRKVDKVDKNETNALYANNRITVIQKGK
jgi:hypothetical protein